MNFSTFLKRLFPFRLRCYGSSVLFLLLQSTGFIPSQRIRYFIYRHLYGMRVDPSSVIFHGAHIRSPKNITIGARSNIGDRSVLDGRGGLTIGDSVNLSTGVWIWTNQHDHQSPCFAETSAPVLIKDYAWISCRTIILPGVTIGEGAVVAAGAVVTKSVSDYSIVAGVPAREIGKRSSDLSYKLGRDRNFPCW